MRMPSIPPHLQRFVPLAIAGAISFVLLISLVMPSTQNNTAHPMVGKPVPNFAIPTLGAPGTLLLSTTWRGQAAVLNVFASWCEPCKAELPHITALRDAGVPLYGLAWRDTDANISNWLAQTGNPYRAVGIDEPGRLTLLLGLSGVPETLLVDKQGNVRWKHAGPLDEASVKELLAMYRTLQ